jgi:hypothetical protein
MSAASRAREAAAREAAKRKQAELEAADMPNPDETPPPGTFFAGRNADGSPKWEADPEFSGLLERYFKNHAAMKDTYGLKRLAVTEEGVEVVPNGQRYMTVIEARDIDRAGVIYQNLLSGIARPAPAFGG